MTSSRFRSFAFAYGTAFAVLYVIGFYALFAGVMYVATGLRLRGLNKTLETASTSAGAAS